MSKYTFRECTLTLLDDTFGLHQVFSSAYLDQWLQNTVAIEEYEKQMLNHLRHLLTINIPGWNEQELSLHFIGPVLSFVSFTEPYRFNLFAERKISATIPGIKEEVELSGEPDGMIATGYREPKIPLFAFTEYKKELDPVGDPAGQTLAAMLVAQVLNPTPIPIYGCYVVGREWFFMVLEEKQYTISQGHNALQQGELEAILQTLKTLKQIVIKQTA